MEIFKDNFDKLLVLIPELADMSGDGKLTAIGVPDIAVNIVERRGRHLILRLSHFIERVLGGDPIPDPDMTIAVYLGARRAEVLTYQDCFGFRQVYRDDLMAFSPLAKRDLNHLLDQWLTKMIEQGRTPCSAIDVKSAC